MSHKLCYTFILFLVVLIIVKALNLLVVDNINHKNSSHRVSYWMRCKADRICGTQWMKTRISWVKLVQVQPTPHKGRLQKKSRTWNIVPTGGGGGPTPWNECPNLLKWYEPKIEPNLLGNPESPNLKKSSQNIHLRMSQVQRGGRG